MEKQRYTCSKCDGMEYKGGEIRTTGSGLSRFLDIQNQKFSTVSCVSCGHTELYRLDGTGVGNILDLFTS